MRRVDGVGELVLADGDVARAAVAGFARGLGERADLDDGGLSLLDFLGSFSAEELAGAGSQLMDAAGPGERADAPGFWQSVTGAKDFEDEPWAATAALRVALE